MCGRRSRLKLLDEISVRIGKLRVDLAQHAPRRLKDVLLDERDKLRMEILRRAYRREEVVLRH
jgi:hypothetical protein